MVNDHNVPEPTVAEVPTDHVHVTTPDRAPPAFCTNPPHDTEPPATAVPVTVGAGSEPLPFDE